MVELSLLRFGVSFPHYNGDVFSFANSCRTCTNAITSAGKVSSSSSTSMQIDRVGARGTAQATNLAYRECSGAKKKQKKRRKALQYVITQGRERFVTWMFNDVQENEQSRMCSRAIVTFSTLFRADRNANLKKASDWWRNRVAWQHIDKQTEISINMRQDGIIQKALSDFAIPRHIEWVQLIEKNRSEVQSKTIAAVGRSTFSISLGILILICELICRRRFLLVGFRGL